MLQSDSQICQFTIHRIVRIRAQPLPVKLHSPSKNEPGILAVNFGPGGQAAESLLQPELQAQQRDFTISLFFKSNLTISLINFTISLQLAKTDRATLEPTTAPTHILDDKYLLFANLSANLAKGYHI